MNQNKGIGAYKDRPGYFLGGMIGGAILGALVNKIQGKDWKRGAVMGGIGGGLGSMWTKAMMPAGATEAATAPWYKKMLFEGGKKLKDISFLKDVAPEAVFGTGIGLGTSWIAGDPEYDRKKAVEWGKDEFLERYNRNKSFYDKWYVNPWTGEEMNPHLGGYNTGGVISARPGYYPGGDVATDMKYVDPDLYTPTGEGKGPTSKPIINIPLGPEPSFMDEFEELDVSETGSGIEAYHKLLADKYRPWLEDMDIDTTGMEDFEVIEIYSELASKYAHSAEGGYKKKAKGGIEDLDLTQGGSSFGPGTGTSDDIPAMLSDGEFVVTAKAVENLGGGDRMLGARKMYQMMNQLDPNSQTPAEMNTVGLT
tara:strand:- start:480 stop:1577 length:1098 start_codon:yes stop_codon:yes gene_type:complete